MLWEITFAICVIVIFFVLYYSPNGKTQEDRKYNIIKVDIQKKCKDDNIYIDKYDEEDDDDKDYRYYLDSIENPEEINDDDNIYADKYKDSLLTSNQWYNLDNYCDIVDPDGWRKESVPNHYWYNVLITRKNYLNRRNKSTTREYMKLKHQAPFKI